MPPMQTCQSQRHACFQPWAAATAGAVLAALAGCSSFPPASFPNAPSTTTAPAPPAPATSPERAAAALDAAARNAAPADRPALQLQAARAWLKAGRAADATRALRGITASLTPAQAIERRIIEADIELANGQAQKAWQMITAIPAPTGMPVAPQYFESRMRIALAAARPVDGVRAEIAGERLATSAAERTRLRTELLAQLREARARGVKLEPEASQDPAVRGWLELGAIAGSSGGASLSGGAEAARWRARYPDHPATELLAGALPGALPVATKLRKVALLLPTSGQAGHFAAAIQAGFDYALQQLPQDSRPTVQLYDTGVLTVEEALRQARAEGSEFIVGPLTRQEVDIAAQAAPGVPMLALNFPSSGHVAPPGMIQYALSPEDEARDIAKRMLAAGQKRGVALGPTGDWGTRVLAAFRDELLAGGGTLLAQGVYDPAGHDFGTPIRNLIGTAQSYDRREHLQDIIGQKLEFEPRARADIDFIFMPAQAGPARLLRPQLRFQYAGDVPVYATSDAYAAEGGAANQDLDGLIVPEMPWLVPDSGAAAALRTTVAAGAGDSTLWQSGLYAFGFDACQLMVAIAAAGRNTHAVHVAGLTGDLRLGDDNRVRREPDWVRITRSGDPQLLPDGGAAGGT
jgi:outer membrane PBP1 activator LpoA protein